MQGYDVLIVRNLIKKVAKDIPTSGTYEVDLKGGNVKELSVHVGIDAYSINVIDEKGEAQKKEVKVNVIDGGGRTLIPGLIDMHSHLAIHEGMLDGRDGFDQMAIGAISQERMRSYLDLGFTTARDAGGNVLGMAKAERLGRIPGPRIYASGAFFSQTGGHGDTGRFNDFPGEQDYLEKHSFSFIVDGEDEIIKAARQNLRIGATQIKIMAGGVALSAQSIISLLTFANPEQITFFSADQQAKGKKLNQGASQMFEWARKHELLIITVGDMFGVADVPRQAVNMTKMKDVGFSPVEILKMGTSSAAQVLPWSGEMNPYKDAYPDLTPDEKAKKSNGLGVIEEGAYADMIVIDGNPLEDVSLSEDYNKNMKLIIRNGKVWKNTLP